MVKYIRDVTAFAKWRCGRELSKTEVLEYKRSYEKLYYLMQTICSSGLRVSELKYLDVNAIKSGQALISCKGKMRLVILPKRLCKMLKVYIKEQIIKIFMVCFLQKDKYCTYFNDLITLLLY